MTRRLQVKPCACGREPEKIEYKNNGDRVAVHSYREQILTEDGKMFKWRDRVHKWPYEIIEK